MRRTSDIVFLLAFAIALWAVAIWVLGHDPLLVKLKRPPGAWLRVDGVRLWLVAAAPALLGCTLASAARRLHQGSRLGNDTVTSVEVAFFWAAIVALLAGLLSAPRVLA